MANAITEKYETLGKLMEAYEALGDKSDRESLLTGLSYDGRKKIRPDISKVIAWLYTKDVLE